MNTKVLMKATFTKECYRCSFPSNMWTSRTSETFLTEVFEVKLRCATFSDVKNNVQKLQVM